MKFHYRHRYIIVLCIFISILSIFVLASIIEYSRSVTDQKKELQTKVQLVTVEINEFVNRNIRNAEGIIAFIQMNPDLNQTDLSNYVSKIFDENDKVISHFAILKDTTIQFVYPLEGNGGAIGVDLSLIESQKEDVLRVKNENISMFVGPVELVQGGTQLINRMPIRIENDVYWGQLSVVIRYEEMLEAAGVSEYALDHYIAIEQDKEKRLFYGTIFSNQTNFSEDAIRIPIIVPNGNWLITTEYKDGYQGDTLMFHLLLILGITFSIIISYSVHHTLKTNEQLNVIVDVRTEDIRKTNQELEKSLEQLKTAQDQLVLREKHAALGELVAGVAHEINTPLGVCVTVNSYIDTVTKNSTHQLKEGTLKKSELEAAFDKINESSIILHENLQRASHLVLSFKKLATDQFLEEYRLINLNEYMAYILNTISPTFKNTQHKIELDIDETLSFETYPGAVFQVFTNLIMNSLIHGFDAKKVGNIRIHAKLDDDNVVIDYQDDGSGIPDELKEKIFDPFFTTKRDEGSTGLGMHIVYNIVYQKLGGSIELLHPDHQGAHFKIVLPSHSN